MTSALSWLLHEFSLHPEAYRLLREEIHMTRQQAFSFGDSELTFIDVNSMKSPVTSAGAYERLLLVVG